MMRALMMVVLLSAFTAEKTLPDAAGEARAQSLFKEIRCMVCEGQAIADSSVPLAIDMRALVRGFIREGKSDADIKAYLVERYGEEILFSPPLSHSTVLLWVTPFMLLLFGLLRLWKAKR